MKPSLSYWPDFQVPRIKFDQEIVVQHRESEVTENNVVHGVAKISQAQHTEYFISRVEVTNWVETDTSAIRELIQKARSLQTGNL